MTVLEAHELLWVIFRNELLCFLKSIEKGLRSVVFGEILAHVCIHDYHLACVISVGTVGSVFLMRVPHVVGMTFTFYNKQETRVASRIFMSRQVSSSLGSSYTPTPLIWWSDVTCTSSKPLCFFLDKDVLSFFRYTSFHSRPGVFVVVHLFPHNRLNGEKLRVSIQRLAKFYNFTWMCRDLFTCNRVRYAKHGETKEKSENMESSEERAAKLTRMLLLEIWEQSFPFRFVVESFKPGGT